VRDVAIFSFTEYAVESPRGTKQADIPNVQRSERRMCPEQGLGILAVTNVPYRSSSMQSRVSASSFQNRSEGRLNFRIAHADRNFLGRQLPTLSEIEL
jgi:hypothetical protein